MGTMARRPVGWIERWTRGGAGTVAAGTATVAAPFAFFFVVYAMAFVGGRTDDPCAREMVLGSAGIIALAAGTTALAMVTLDPLDPEVRRACLVIGWLTGTVGYAVFFRASGTDVYWFFFGAAADLVQIGCIPLIGLLAILVPVNAGLPRRVKPALAFGVGGALTLIGALTLVTRGEYCVIYS